MKFSRSTHLFSVVVGLFFLIFAILTLKDYNMMWDARGHFTRGQSFARFLLFRQVDYENIPISKDFARYFRDYLKKSSSLNFDPQKARSKDPNYRRSIYQDQSNNGIFNKLTKEGPVGHPPLSDVFAAIFNIIFYEKLGLLRDDLAYNLFTVFLSSVLVTVVFYWIKKVYGNFAAIVATLSLVTFPLFWAESHFNIKDVPELVFFSFTIWAFWNGIMKKSKKWILVSAVFAGFALGTKFNIVFLPFILIPWFLVLYLKQTEGNRRRYHSLWWLLLAYPLIMLSVLFIASPHVWRNPVGSLLQQISYYKDIGTNIDYTPKFRTVLGFNAYPLIWTIITSYPWVLFLSIVGCIVSITKFIKSRDTLPFLFLLWFLVPIARVSLPKSAIYDGVRQIMEFIPAMAILAGIGANEISKRVSGWQSHLFKIIIVLFFIPLIVTLVKTHPAENAYFNSLIGGLEGAKAHKINGWGNTDGGIYSVAVDWLNKNAERNSHIAVGFSEPADFYIPSLREDLIADNQFSGFLQKGEYIVALTHNSELENTYRMAYPENFLKLLYAYDVDGVPLVKIWKNEDKYLKKEFSNQREISLMPQREGATLSWDLGRSEYPTKITMNFKENKDCASLNGGYFKISQGGNDWIILSESYPGNYIEALGEQPKGNSLTAGLAGGTARYISFTADSPNACVLNIESSSIKVVHER